MENHEGLKNRLAQQDAGHDRIARVVPFEKRLSRPDRAAGHRPGFGQRDDFIHKQKRRTVWNGAENFRQRLCGFGWCHDPPACPFFRRRQNDSRKGAAGLNGTGFRATGHRFRRSLLGKRLPGTAFKLVASRRVPIGATRPTREKNGSKTTRRPGQSRVPQVSVRRRQEFPST